MAEIVVNLWAIYDASVGFIYALSGRAYGVDGTDSEKLAILRSLSGTDYVTAKRYELPPRFALVFQDGTRKVGLAPVSVVHDPDAQLFEDMFKNLERELPPLTRLEGYEAVNVRQHVPQDPLCIVTIVYEDEAGNSRPILSAHDRAWMKEQEISRGRIPADA